MKSIINSEQSLETYKKLLDAQFKKHKYLRMNMVSGRTRSLTQNKCLHLFCSQLAEELNAGGFDFRGTLKEGYQVPWNGDLVKNYIWRPVQKAITGKDSTTKPTKQEYNIIYDAINVSFMAERGLYIPWPNKELKEGL